jgi:hypothetical protein
VGLVSALYKIARIANDVRVLSSGNPKRIARHYANKAIGRYPVLRKPQEYTHEEISKFAKNAGRPVKLDGRARRRLRQLLAAGRSQAECAAELGVSIRTIGRAVARMRVGPASRSNPRRSKDPH